MKLRSKIILVLILFSVVPMVTMGLIFYYIVKKGLLEPKFWIDREEE